MSGLISSLQNSSGALRVHSKGLEVVGKNLANINNPGYAKQRVSIGDRGSVNTGVATESMGVEVMALKQNRESILDKVVMRETSAIKLLEGKQSVLNAAQSALGQFLDRTKDSNSIDTPLGAAGGAISDALSEFFNSWETFSVKPNDVGVKELIVQKSKILSEKLNEVHARLTQVQEDVQSQVNSDFNNYKKILDEIKTLNNEIAKAEIGKPYSAVDLRDQRQAKLEMLTKLTDANFVNSVASDGQIKITSKGGADDQASNITLLDGQNISKFGDDITIDLSSNSSPFEIKTFLDRRSLDSQDSFNLGEYEGKDPLLESNIGVSFSELQAINSQLTQPDPENPEAGVPDTVETIESHVRALLENNPRFTQEGGAALDLKVTDLKNGKFQIDFSGDVGDGESPIHNFSFSSILTISGNSATSKADVSLFSSQSSGITLQMESGLAGQVDASKTDVQKAINEVEQLASVLKSEVNNIYGSDFFLLAQPNGKLDLQFNTNVTVSNLKATGTGRQGANELALNLASLANKTFSSTVESGAQVGIDGTFVGAFNRTVTGLATTLSAVNSSIEDRKLSLENASNARDAYSGVSQDEEITDMMKFQRSFQASARHVQIIDTLLDQVVNRLGVG
jgi:flagellar hook-associated protein 1 FlgK